MRCSRNFTKGINKMKKPTPETDAVAAYEGNWDTKALRMTVHARKLERERDDAREKAERYRIEANAMMMQRDEWAAMCGRYKQERDEARGQVKELIYISGRAIDLAEIDFKNDKFGIVSELRDGLKKIKEETK
jgi:uncharacterized coiled-coil DUF342 family protein